MKFAPLACIALTLVLFTAPHTFADDRRYTYIFETTPMEKGELEYEQWATWSSFKDGDVFDFRHELEYGLAENLKFSLYLANWSYEKPRGGKSRARFDTTSLEAIYTLTNPHESPWGTALFGEVGIGEEEVGLEGKFLLEKVIGPVDLAYNFKFGTEWMGEDLENLSQNDGLFGNYLGASYQFSPRFLGGAELVHEWETESWETRGDDRLSLGPNLSWRGRQWYVTATALWGLLDSESAPTTQIRILAEVSF